MEIGSPLFYNKADEQILAQCGSFHERHYSVRVPDDPNKEFILRFAADFGLFKMVQQAQFSYKQLPLRFFEYSSNFRYEKSGELSGLKRDRFFHMADIHCFCKDEEQAIKEYKEICCKYEDLNSGMGIKYANVLRIVDVFYDKFKNENPMVIRDILYYFSPMGGGRNATATGLSELIADVHTLMLTYGHSDKDLRLRINYLTKYFPETIAKVGTMFGYNQVEQ
jgi:threonyl-tRNA synthetase